MLKKVIKYLRQRNNTYWQVYLSRCEHNKFWLSEHELRQYIELLRANWLKLVCKDRSGGNFFSNRYDVTQELLDFFDQIVWAYRPTFRKVTKLEIIKFLQNLWIEYKNYIQNYVLRKERGKKYTLNVDTWIITCWSREIQWYNFYKWIKFFN